MKLLSNLRKILSDDKVLYRIAFCGILIGMVCIYMSLVDMIQTVTDDVRIGVIQQENMVCSPLYDNDGVLRFVCEVPNRELIRENLYK